MSVFLGDLWLRWHISHVNYIINNSGWKYIVCPEPVFDVDILLHAEISEIGRFLVHFNITHLSYFFALAVLSCCFEIWPICANVDIYFQY